MTLDANTLIARRIAELPPYLFARLDALRAEKAAAGVDVIPVSIGDPDLPTPEPVVERLREPRGEGVRLDSALYEGYEVSPYYEPMMAKLIVWADDRAAAIDRMRRALDEFDTEGLVNNTALVRRVLDRSLFVEARHDNTFLEEVLRAPVSDGGGKELIAALAVAMALAEDKAERTEPGKWKMYGRRAAMVSRLSGGAF